MGVLSRVGSCRCLHTAPETHTPLHTPPTGPFCPPSTTTTSPLPPHPIYSPHSSPHFTLYPVGKKNWVGINEWMGLPKVHVATGVDSQRLVDWVLDRMGR